MNRLALCRRRIVIECSERTHANVMPNGNQKLTQSTLRPPSVEKSQRTVHVYWPAPLKCTTHIAIMLLCVDYNPLSLLSFTRDGIDCLRLLYKCRRAVCGNKYSKIVVACPSSDFPVPSSIVMQRILTFFTCQFRYLNYEISFIFIVIFCHFAPVLCPHDY